MPPSPQPPERTLDQRLDALKAANRKRLRRADIKRRLRTGDLTVLEVMESSEEDIQGMRLYELILAVPRFGRVRTEAFLAQNDISVVKTLGGLSPRQLRAVIASFRSGPPVVEMHAGRVLRPTNRDAWHILNLQARVADLEAEISRKAAA